MATNRNIVATRKLNEKNKARLRSTGDTEYGVIEGRLSHINKDEKRRLTAADAYDISLRERVEADIVREGAGTINPFDGMPEYHVTANWKHMADHAKETKIGDVVDYIAPSPISLYENISGKETGISTPGELIDDPSKKLVDFEQIGLTEPEEEVKIGKKLSYDELKEMRENDPDAYQKYLATWGLETSDDEFLTGFEEDPFEFFRDQQELITGEIDPETGLPIDPTTGRAGETRGFTERGLQSTYGATMGALGSQQAALGRTTGRGISQAIGGANIAASRSGLATSGTITQGLETQKKELFQDYSAGMKDIGRQRGTALDTLTLGQDVAAADYDYSVEGAGLDFRQAEYLEKRRQLDKYYDELGVIPS